VLLFTSVYQTLLRDLGKTFMAMKKKAPKKTDPKPPKSSMKQKAKDAPTTPNRAAMAKAPESRMTAKAVNARNARDKFESRSNKPRGKFASESVQKQASDVARTQEMMFPGTKFRGYTTVKPGRADAKPSPKKVVKQKKR
jgi:hypothetical protein